MFHRTFVAAKGYVERLEPSWTTIQVTMYAKIGDQRKSEVAGDFVLGGEGRSNEGWTVSSGIVNQICTDCGVVVFATLF